MSLEDISGAFFAASIILLLAGGWMMVSASLSPILKPIVEDTDLSSTIVFSYTSDSNEDESSEYSPRPNYLETKHQKLLNSGKKFIDIRLDHKRVRMYENGRVTREYPVRAIASKTSWWRTAPGFYKAQGKLPTHESSFGNVIMPWNIPFQGNFFIHGWPYYPGGAPAESAVSGGCIRIDKEDAKALYESTGVGTPIVIRDGVFNPGLTHDILETKPNTTADAYLAADMRQDEILLRKGANNVQSVGDISTLLSALTISERIGMETDMYADKTLLENQDDELNTERLRTYDLLFPLLQDWSEGVPTTVASYMGDSSFESALSYKKQALGMDNSSVSLDEGKVRLETTALDLANLAGYTRTYRNFIFDISASNETINLYGEPRTGRRGLPRMFPGYDDFVGGAYDEETESALAVFELPAISSSSSIGAKEEKLPDVDGDPSTTPFLFIAFDSEDSLETILNMRAAVLNESKKQKEES